MASVLEPVRQLAGGCRLTGTLEASHQHYRWRLRGELDAGRVAAEDFDQLVVHDLDDLLAGRERSRDLLAEGLDLNLIDELFDDLDVDVSFEQSHADFPQGLLDVFFGERALAAEVFEGALEFAG